MALLYSCHDPEQLTRLQKLTNTNTLKEIFPFQLPPGLQQEFMQLAFLPEYKQTSC